MLAVLANTIAIIVGAFLGLILRRFLTEHLTKTVEQALGFLVILIGIKMGLEFQNIFLLLGCTIVGVIIGTLIRLEDRVEALGEKLQKFSNSSDNKFVQGFVMSSVIYCTGAMAVIGAINAGAGDNELLFTKSILDGVISISLASVFGIGVAFSALPVLLYQGLIALGAGSLDFLKHPELMKDVTGVGGLIVMMIGIRVADIAKIPIGNYLPAVLLVIVAGYFVYV